MMKKFVKRALLLSVFLVALFALTMLGASAATGDTTKGDTHVASAVVDGTPYYYTNLVTAISEADDKSVVTVLQNASIASAFTIDGKTLTLEGGTHTVTVSASITLKGEADISIQNVTISASKGVFTPTGPCSISVSDSIVNFTSVAKFVLLTGVIDEGVYNLSIENTTFTNFSRVFHAYKVCDTTSTPCPNIEVHVSMTDVTATGGSSSMLVESSDTSSGITAASSVTLTRVNATTESTVLSSSASHNLGTVTIEDCNFNSSNKHVLRLYGTTNYVAKDSTFESTSSSGTDGVLLVAADTVTGRFENCEFISYQINPCVKVSGATTSLVLLDCTYTQNANPSGVTTTNLPVLVAANNSAAVVVSGTLPFADDTTAVAANFKVRVGDASQKLYATLISRPALATAYEIVGDTFTVNVLASHSVPGGAAAAIFGDGAEAAGHYTPYHVTIVGVGTTYPTVTVGGADRFLLYDGSDVTFTNINISSTTRWIRIYNRYYSETVNGKTVEYPIDYCDIVFGDNCTVSMNTTNSGAEDFIYSEGASYCNITVEQTATISKILTAADGANRRLIAFNGSIGSVIIKGTLIDKITGLKSGSTGGTAHLFNASGSQGFIFIDSTAVIVTETCAGYTRKNFAGSSETVAIAPGATYNGEIWVDTDEKALAMGLKVRNNKSDGSLALYANALAPRLYTVAPTNSTLYLLGDVYMRVANDGIADKTFVITSEEGSTHSVIATDFAAVVLEHGAHVTFKNINIDLVTKGVRMARIDGSSTLIFGDGCTVEHSAAIFIYNNGSGGHDLVYTIDFQSGSTITSTGAFSHGLIYHNSCRATVHVYLAGEITMTDGSPLVKDVGYTSGGKTVYNSRYYVYYDAANANVTTGGTTWFTNVLLNSYKDIYVSAKGFASHDAADEWAATHIGATLSSRSYSADPDEEWPYRFCANTQFLPGMHDYMTEAGGEIMILRDLTEGVNATMNFTCGGTITIKSKNDAYIFSQDVSYRFRPKNGTTLVLDGILLKSDGGAIAIHSGTAEKHSMLKLINGARIEANVTDGITLISFANADCAYADLYIGEGCSITQSGTTTEGNTNVIYINSGWSGTITVKGTITCATNTTGSADIINLGGGGCSGDIVIDGGTLNMQAVTGASTCYALRISGNGYTGTVYLTSGAINHTASAAEPAEGETATSFAAGILYLVSADATVEIHANAMTLSCTPTGASSGVLMDAHGLVYIKDLTGDAAQAKALEYGLAVRYGAADTAPYSTYLTTALLAKLATNDTVKVLRDYTLTSALTVDGKTVILTATSSDMTLALGTNAVTLQNGAYLTLQALKLTSAGTDNATPPFTFGTGAKSTLKLLNVTYTSTTGCDFVHVGGSGTILADVILQDSNITVNDSLLQTTNTGAGTTLSLSASGCELRFGTGFYTGTTAAPTVALTIADSTVNATRLTSVDSGASVKLTVTLTGTKSGATDASATYTNVINTSDHVFSLAATGTSVYKIMVTGTSLNAPEKNVLHISGLADVAAGEGMTDMDGNGNYALYFYAEDIYARCFQFVFSSSANVTGGDILIELGGEKNGTGDSATHSNVVEFSTTGTSQLAFIFVGSSKPDTFTARVRGTKATSTSASSDILFLYPTPAANDAVEYPIDVEFEGVTLSCVRRVLNMVDNTTGVPVRIAFLDGDMTAGDTSTYSNEVYGGEIVLLLRSAPEFYIVMEGMVVSAGSSSIIWAQAPIVDTGSITVEATNVYVEKCSSFVQTNAAVLSPMSVTLNKVHIVGSNLLSKSGSGAVTFDFTAVYFDDGETMAANGAVAGVRVGAGYEYYSDGAAAAAAADGLVATEATFGDYVILLYDENALSEEDQLIAQGMVAKYTNEDGELVYTDSLHTAINEAKSGTIVYVLNNCTMTGSAGNDATAAGRYVKVVTITSGNNGPFTVTASPTIPFYLGAGSGVTFTNVKFIFNGRFGRIDGNSEIVFGENAEIVANADIFIYSNKDGTLSAPTYSITVAETASINWTHATTTNALFYIASVTNYDFNVTLNLYGTITVASPKGAAAIFSDLDKGAGTTVTVNMTNKTVLDVSTPAFNLTKGGVTLSGFDTDAKADVKARELGLVARYDGKYYPSFMAVTVAAAEDTDVVIYLINNFTITSGNGIAVGTDSPTSTQNTGLTLPAANKLTIIGINVGTEQAPVYPTLTSNSNRAFGTYNAADLELQTLNITTAARLLQVNGAGSADNPINITLGDNVKITVRLTDDMNGGELLLCGGDYTNFTINETASVLYDFTAYAGTNLIDRDLIPVQVSGANSTLTIYGNITVNVPDGILKSGKVAACIAVTNATSTINLHGAAPLSVSGVAKYIKAATSAALNVTGAANATLPCLIGQEAGYVACIAGATSGTYLFKTSLDTAFTDVAEGGTIWVLNTATQGQKGDGSTSGTNDKSWTKSLTVTSGGKGISTVNCTSGWAAFVPGGGVSLTFTNINYVLSTRFARLDGSCNIVFGEGASVAVNTDIFIYANNSAVAGSVYNITVEDGASLKWTYLTPTTEKPTGAAMIYTSSNTKTSTNLTLGGDMEINVSPAKPLLYFNNNATPVVKFEGTASVTGGASKLINVPYNSPIKLYMKGFDTMDAANAFAVRTGAYLLYSQSQSDTPNGALYGGFSQLYNGNFDVLNGEDATITVISTIKSINGTIWLTAGNNITIKSWNGAVLGSQSGEHRIRIAGGTDLILDGVTVENPGALFALHGGFEDNHTTLKLINGARIVGTVGSTAGYPGRLISFAGESYLSNTTSYGEAGGASAYSDLYVDEGCEIKQTGTAADSTSLIYICDNWYGTVTVKGKVSAQVTFPTTTVGASGGGAYHARLLYMDNTVVTATSGTVVLAPTAVLDMNATFPFVDAQGNSINTATQAVPTHHTACCIYLTGVQGRVFVADGATVTNTHSGASTSSATVCGSFSTETGKSYVLAGVTLNGTYYLVGIAEQVRPGASAGTSDRVVIADANGAYYPIVYKDGAFYNAQGHSLVSLSNTWGGEIAELINSLLGITGATHRTDATTTANEILVGRVDRAEYSAYLQTLEVNEYAIVIQNGKVMLVAWNDATLKLCVDQFKAILTACVTTVNGVTSISLPASLEQVVVARPEWVVSFTRPSESGDVSLSASQYVNNDSVQFLYTGEGATQITFMTYYNKLIAQGYTKVWSNNIGNNLYALLVNHDTGVTLYVAYCDFAYASDFNNTLFPQEESDLASDYTGSGTPDFSDDHVTVDYEKCIRVISAPIGSLKLPSEELINGKEYTKITDTKMVTLPFRSKAIGLGYVYLLEDGSFFILDGGGVNVIEETTNSEGTTYYPNANGVTEWEAMWNVIVELYTDLYGKAPSETNKVHISAWYLTHSHGDHYQAFYQMLQNYGKMIDMDYMLGNFAGEYTNSLISELAWGATDTYIKRMQGFVGGFDFVKLHAGQVLHIVNLDIEVLMTFEDHLPHELRDSNDTSTVSRFTVNNSDAAEGALGTTIMMLGDSWRMNSRHLCVMFGGDVNGNGNYLGADIVQAAHHCNVGCERILYKRIAARAVLISNDTNATQGYLYWGNIVGNNTNWYRAYLYMADKWLISNEYVNYVLAAPYANSAEGAGAVFNVLEFTSTGPNFDGIYDLFTGTAVTYNDGSNPLYIKNTSNTVTSVQIAWGSFSFTYSGEQGTWNPDTHEYEGGSEAGWVADGNNTITVMNTGDTALTVAVDYTAASGYESFEGSFTADGAAVTKGQAVTLASRQQRVYIFNLTTDELPDESMNHATVGSIKLTIAQ